MKKNTRVNGERFVNLPIFDLIVHEGVVQSVPLRFAEMPTNLS
jgi:hypothetical protein